MGHHTRRTDDPGWDEPRSSPRYDTRPAPPTSPEYEYIQPTAINPAKTSSSGGSSRQDRRDSRQDDRRDSHLESRRDSRPIITTPLHPTGAYYPTYDPSDRRSSRDYAYSVAPASTRYAPSPANTSNFPNGYGAPPRASTNGFDDRAIPRSASKRHSGAEYHEYLPPPRQHAATFDNAPRGSYDSYRDRDHGRHRSRRSSMSHYYPPPPDREYRSSRDDRDFDSGKGSRKQRSKSHGHKQAGDDSAQGPGGAKDHVHGGVKRTPSEDKKWHREKRKQMERDCPGFDTTLKGVGMQTVVLGVKAGLAALAKV